MYNMMLINQCLNCFFILFYEIYEA